MSGDTLRPASFENSSIYARQIDQTNKAIDNALKTFATRKYASEGDLIAAQLVEVINALNSDEGKYFSCYPDLYQSLVVYFYELAKSSHMPAFARYITQTTPESTKWITANPQAMADLDNWLKATERSF